MRYGFGVCPPTPMISQSMMEQGASTTQTVITAQYPTFSEVDNTIEEALSEITEYYRNNSLRANPDKTQVTEQRSKEIIKSVMEWC